MNCKLDLQKDIKNDGVLDKIKKLSDKSRLFLEKGPAYQNDIKKVTLVVGFGGTIIEKIPFDFQLTTEWINNYSSSYKFYDIEENKVRDCKIYSPHNHLQNDGVTFKSDTFTGGSTYHVLLDEKMENIMTKLEYNHYNCDFVSVTLILLQFFIFDKKNDDFIGSDSNYHLLANDKFQRYGKPEPVVKSSLFYYYMLWRPENTTLIVNQDVWNHARA